MKEKISDVVVPSKKSVDKAGDILIGLIDSTDEERQKALAIFHQWRAVHAYPINTFQALFRKKLSKLNIDNIVFAQRLKRAPSIFDKLNRLGPNRPRLSKIQDIAGIRIIVPKIQDVYTVIDDYSNNLRPHEAVKLVNYINNPKNDGYRSVHQIFKLVSNSNPNLSGLKIELQIRTQLQHQWATAVEVLGLARETSYKSGFGDDRHKKFLSICSNLFAIEEGTPIHPDYHHLTKIQLCYELKKLNDELQIIDSLKAMRVASNKIIEDTIVAKAHVCLILLKLDEKRLRITEYSKEKSDMAQKRYAEYEQEILAKKLNWDVVLVSVDNIDKLKKAFPNYYLDTKEFIQSIQKYISKCDK